MILKPKVVRVIIDYNVLDSGRYKRGKVNFLVVRDHIVNYIKLLVRLICNEQIFSSIKELEKELIILDFYVVVLVEMDLLHSKMNLYCTRDNYNKMGVVVRDYKDYDKKSKLVWKNYRIV